MVVISRYLERDKNRVLKYQTNDSSYFKISAKYFYVTHLKTFKLNKHRVALLEGTRYMQS